MIRNLLVLALLPAALAVSSLPAQAGILGTLSKGVLVYKGVKAIKKAGDGARQGRLLLDAARNSKRLRD